MIPKNNRIYIREWFNKNQPFKDGDVIEFEMPPFCSGDYEARIYIDSDGDPYIDKSNNYYRGCRDLFIRENSELNISNVRNSMEEIVKIISDTFKKDEKVINYVYGYHIDEISKEVYEKLVEKYEITKK